MYETSESLIEKIYYHFCRLKYVCIKYVRNLNCGRSGAIDSNIRSGNEEKQFHILPTDRFVHRYNSKQLFFRDIVSFETSPNICARGMAPNNEGSGKPFARHSLLSQRRG